MKSSSSSSSSIISSISELYPLNMEWKSYRNKLSSMVLSLLALSAIFILFVLLSSNPFSVIDDDIGEGADQIQPLLQNNAGAGTRNTIIPDEGSAAVPPPTSSGSTGIQQKDIRSQKPPPLDQNTTAAGNVSIPNESSVVATPPASSESIANEYKEARNQDPQLLERNTTNTGSMSVPGESGTTATPPASSESVDNRSIVGPECDLFAGKWVRDARGPMYTNASCRTLPDVRNCAKYGKDQGYVYWRWKPDGCELPRFDPATFLSIVRGKKLMFIGDSLARNMMESLLCLLSQAEIPIDTYKDAKDKHRTWYFPTHNFTLMVIWTEFLVDGAEIINNGVPSNTFNIHVDRMHPMWANILPELSYAVVNGGNWFTRRTYIHRRGKLIGCVHCVGENIPSISVPAGVRMVFKAAFKYISRCKECGDLLTLLRTYSMSHFEHGSWLDGGYCNRTRPLEEEEVSSRGGPWEFRKIQMEELERARKLGKKKFGLLDVTKAMILRADAHPGKYWIAKQTNDCLHWCLPGAIDMWSELLLEVLKRST